MALRLGEYVVKGELYNVDRNSTHGWLLLRDQPETVTFELTGNPWPDLIGKRLRFACSEREFGGAEHLSAKGREIPGRFVGAVGDITIERQNRVFECSVEEFLHRSKLGEPLPTFWKRCLYLEWYGNCGRVVIEMVDPQACLIEEVDGEEIALPLPPLPPAPFDPNNPPKPSKEDSGMEITEVELIDENTARITRHETADTEEEEDSPYALFSDDFKKLIQADEKPGSKYTQELKIFDSILDGSAEEDSLRSLIGPTPDWSEMSDEEIETKLLATIGKLGLYNIAYHICPHYSMAQACKYLFEELADEKIHPEQLPKTGFFQHFSTPEDCPQCVEEMES